MCIQLYLCHIFFIHSCVGRHSGYFRILAHVNNAAVNTKKPASLDNVDEHGGHYAKWNKPRTKKQILHGATYMWNLKELELLEAESGG